MLVAVQRAIDRLRTGLLRVRDQWLTREEAESRALVLLRAWLSPAQRAQFGAYRYFDVTGSDTGRHYRIRYGTATNVYELDQHGRIHVGWCFRPAGRLSAGDVMLAQKIALETDELGALAVANKFPGVLPPRSSQLPFG